MSAVIDLTGDDVNAVDTNAEKEDEPKTFAQLQAQTEYDQCDQELFLEIACKSENYGQELTDFTEYVNQCCDVTVEWSDVYDEFVAYVACKGTADEVTLALKMFPELNFGTILIAMQAYLSGGGTIEDSANRKRFKRIMLLAPRKDIAYAVEHVLEAAGTNTSAEEALETFPSDWSMTKRSAQETEIAMARFKAEHCESESESESEGSDDE